MADTKHNLEIRTTVKDLASRDLKVLGETGKRTGASIAAGFIKAQIAIGGFKLALRGVIGFVKSITTDIAEQNDQIAKMAQQVNVSVEFLSEMGHAAEFSGSSMEILQRGLRNVSRNIRMVQSGSPEMIRAYQDIGIAAEDLVAMKPEQAFIAIAEQLSKFPEGAEQVGLAMRTVGEEAGPRLLPLLRQGSEGIAALRGEVRRFGLSINTEQARMAEAFQDAKKRLAGAILGIKNATATELFPVLTDTLNRAARYISENREALVAILTKLVKEIGAFIFEALQAVATEIAGLVDALESAGASGIADKLTKNWQRVFLNTALELRRALDMPTRDLIDALKVIESDIGPKEKAVAEAFARVRAGVMASYQKIQESAAQSGRDSFDAYMDAFEDRMKQRSLEWDRFFAGIRNRAVTAFGEMPAAGRTAELVTGMPQDPGIQAMDFLSPIREQLALMGESNATTRETIGIEQEYYRLRKQLSEIQGLTTEQWESAVAVLDEYREAQERLLYVEEQNQEKRLTFMDGLRKGVEQLRESLSPEQLGITAVQMATNSYTRFFDAIAFGSMKAGDALRAFALDALRSFAQLANQQALLQLFQLVLGGAPSGYTQPQPGGLPAGWAMSQRGGTVAPSTGVR